MKFQEYGFQSTSDLYSTTGKWSYVECVRSTMDTMQVQKIQWTCTLVDAFQYENMVIIWTELLTLNHSLIPWSVLPARQASLLLQSKDIANSVT